MAQSTTNLGKIHVFPSETLYNQFKDIIADNDLALLKDDGAYIVAALLEQNGYVKFSNGLILQWGACERGTLEISFLLTMSNTNYNINKQLTQYYDGVSYSRETCVYDLDVSGCKTYGTTSSFRWLVIGW